MTAEQKEREEREQREREQRDKLEREQQEEKRRVEAERRATEVAAQKKKDEADRQFQEMFQRLCRGEDVTKLSKSGSSKVTRLFIEAEGKTTYLCWESKNKRSNDARICLDDSVVIAEGRGGLFAGKKSIGKKYDPMLCITVDPNDGTRHLDFVCDDTRSAQRWRQFFSLLSSRVAPVS